MCFCNLTQYLADIQNNLSKRIIEEDYFGEVKKVAGVDVSFSSDEKAVVAAVVIEYKSLKVLGEKTAEVDIQFPYISGFLGFRESHPMASVLKKIENYDVLMVNGHGIMHPRGFGLASHVGLLMNIPTIGVAKRLIGGNYKLHDNQPKIIKMKGKPVGACDKHKCISIGHKISLNSAIKIVNQTTLFKIPEPIRLSHILATETMKKLISDLNGN
jgi:deoxyribonuclease V